MKKEHHHMFVGLSSGLLGGLMAFWIILLGQTVTASLPYLILLTLILGFVAIWFIFRHLKRK